MSGTAKPLRVAFVHPDLGIGRELSSMLQKDIINIPLDIGGAERLVVDAAVGLQRLGHDVNLYTSYHDPGHCFEETRDGTLKVHHVVPPFPRSLRGKFHILLAHLRQLHLTLRLLSLGAPKYDVYFVDQLSTCVPFLRILGQTRVVFYCHFPDKLLANGAFVEGNLVKNNSSLLKRLYRLPMDWWEEITTRQADVILANSRFTGRIFKSYFPSIRHTPQVVYPGINISAYETEVDDFDSDILAITSPRPSLISLNRFEEKKNAQLALESFALLIQKESRFNGLRLVLAGGYDERLPDNVRTLNTLVARARSLALTYNIISPVALPPPAAALTTFTADPQVLILLNFTTSQRTALLLGPSTLALLYTPANEHFGIVPVEAMACGVPVLACDSGGPTESVVTSPPAERTGWLETPDAAMWARALLEIVSLSPVEREQLSERAKVRARTLFGIDTMARDLDGALHKAVSMGRVDFLGGYGAIVLMFTGFVFAYLVGPFL